MYPGAEALYWEQNVYPPKDNIHLLCETIHKIMGKGTQVQTNLYKSYDNSILFG